MLYTQGDVDLLRLTGRYRWLPYTRQEALGYDDILTPTDKLARQKLVYISKTREYFYLTKTGYEILDALGFPCSPGRKRAYSGAVFLRRRLDAARIMLTCLRAGIDCAQSDLTALRGQSVFYPAFDMRPQIMNCSSCSGFGHWGDTAYMLQHIGPNSTGMYTANELGVFHNLTALFEPSPLSGVQTALIIAGESYTDVYRRLTSPTLSGKNGKNGFEDFWSYYRSGSLPVHLLSCNDVGTKQLRIMSKPGYREKIAKAAFGDKWIPKDTEIPEADGSYNGRPVVIAADMDIRRIERVVESARRLGRNEVLIAALEEQVRELLYALFPPKGFTTLLVISDDILQSAFGKHGKQTADSAIYDGKGGVIHG